MKCKPYSEITVEIRTQLKTVNICSVGYLHCKSHDLLQTSLGSSYFLAHLCILYRSLRKTGPHSQVTRSSTRAQSKPKRVPSLARPVVYM